MFLFTAVELGLGLMERFTLVIKQQQGFLTRCFCSLFKWGRVLLWLLNSMKGFREFRKKPMSDLQYLFLFANAKSVQSPRNEALFLLCTFFFTKLAHCAVPKPVCWKYHCLWTPPKCSYQCSSGLKLTKTLNCQKLCFLFWMLHLLFRLSCCNWRT